MNSGRTFPQQMLNNRFQNFNPQQIHGQNRPIHAQQRFQLPNMAANNTPRLPVQPTFPGSSAQVVPQINRSWQQIQPSSVQNTQIQQPSQISPAVPNAGQNPLADPNLVQKQIHEFHRLQVMLRHIQQQRQRQQEQQQQQQQQQHQRRQQLIQQIQAIQRARAQGVNPQSTGLGHTSKISQMEKMIRDMIKYRDQLKQEAAFRQKTRQVESTNSLQREDVMAGPSILVMDKEMVTEIPVVTTKKPNGSLGQSMIVFAKTANIHSNVESQTNNAAEQRQPELARQQTSTTSNPVVLQNQVQQQQQYQFGNQHQTNSMPQLHLPPQQNNLASRINTEVMSATFGQNSPNSHHAIPSQSLHRAHGHQPTIVNNNHQHVSHTNVNQGHPNQNRNVAHINNGTINSNLGHQHQQNQPNNHNGNMGRVPPPKRPTQIQLPPLQNMQQQPHLEQRTPPPLVQLPTLNLLSVKNQQPMMHTGPRPSSAGSNLEQVHVDHHKIGSQMPSHQNNHIHSVISTESPRKWNLERSLFKPTTTTTTPAPVHLQKPILKRQFMKRPPRPRLAYITTTAATTTTSSTTPAPVLHHQNPIPYNPHSHVQPVSMRQEMRTAPREVTPPPQQYITTTFPNTTPRPTLNDYFNKMSRPRPQKVRISFRKPTSLAGSVDVPVKQVTTPAPIPTQPTTIPFIPTSPMYQLEPTTQPPIVPTRPSFQSAPQGIPVYQHSVERVPNIPSPLPPLPTVQQVQNYQTNYNHHPLPARLQISTEPSIQYYTTTSTAPHHQRINHHGGQTMPAQNPIPLAIPNFNQNHNANPNANRYFQPSTTTQATTLHLSHLRKWEAEMKINTRKSNSQFGTSNRSFPIHHQVTTTTERPRFNPPTPQRTENPLAKLLKLLQRKKSSIKFATDRQNLQRSSASGQLNIPATTTERPLEHRSVQHTLRNTQFPRPNLGQVPRPTQISQTSQWSSNRLPTADPGVSSNIQTARNNFRRFDVSPFSTRLPFNNRISRIHPTSVPSIQIVANSNRQRQPPASTNTRNRNIPQRGHLIRKDANEVNQRKHTNNKPEGPVNPAQLLIAALIQALQSGNLLKQLQKHQQNQQQPMHQPVHEHQPAAENHYQPSPPTYNQPIKQQQENDLYMKEQSQIDVQYHHAQENHVQRQEPQSHTERHQHFGNGNQNSNHQEIVKYNTKPQKKAPKDMPDLSMLQGQDVQFTDVNTGFGGESPPPVIIQRIPKNSRSRSNGNSNSVSYELPTMALHENSAVVIDTSNGDSDDTNSTSDKIRSNFTDDDELSLPKLSTIFARKTTEKAGVYSSTTIPTTNVNNIKLLKSDSEIKEEKKEESNKTIDTAFVDDKPLNLVLPSFSPFDLDYESTDLSTPPPLFEMKKSIQSPNTIDDMDSSKKKKKDDMTTTTINPLTNFTSTTEKPSTIKPEVSTISTTSTTSLPATTTVLKNKKVEPTTIYNKETLNSDILETVENIDNLQKSSTTSSAVTLNLPTVPTTTVEQTTSIPITSPKSTNFTSKPIKSNTDVIPSTTDATVSFKSTTQTSTTTLGARTTRSFDTFTKPTTVSVTNIKSTAWQIPDSEIQRADTENFAFMPLHVKSSNLILERDDEREYNTKISTTTTTTSKPTTKPVIQTTPAPLITTTEKKSITDMSTMPFFFTTIDYRALYPELFGLRPLMVEPVVTTTTPRPSTTTQKTTTTPLFTTSPTATTLRTTTVKPLVTETTTMGTTSTSSTSPPPTTTTAKTTTKPLTTTTPLPVTRPAWMRETTQHTTDMSPFTFPTTIDYRDIFAEMFGRKPVPSMYGTQEAALEKMMIPDTTKATVTTTPQPTVQRTAFVGMSLENSRQYRHGHNISPTVLTYESNTVETGIPQRPQFTKTVLESPQFIASNNLNGGHKLAPQTLHSTTPRSVRVLGRDIVVKTTAQSFTANHISGTTRVRHQPVNHITDFVQDTKAGSLSQQSVIREQQNTQSQFNNAISQKADLKGQHFDVVDIPYDPHSDRASTLLSGNNLPKQYREEPKVASTNVPAIQQQHQQNMVFAEPENIIDLNAFSTDSLSANPNSGGVGSPSNAQGGVADVSTQLDSLLSALGSDIMIHEQKSSDGHVQYKIHGGHKDLPAFVLRTGYKWADTFG